MDAVHWLSFVIMGDQRIWDDLGIGLCIGAQLFKLVQHTRRERKLELGENMSAHDIDEVTRKHQQFQTLLAVGVQVPSDSKRAGKLMC